MLTALLKVVLPMSIRFQHFKKVPLFSAGQLLLEVTESMHEDIDW